MDERVRCTLCGQSVPLLDVSSHRCPPAQVVDVPLVEYSDLEENLKQIYDAPSGVMMEEAMRESHPSIGSHPDSVVYKLSRTDGGHAGWMEKAGTDFHLYDRDALLLKRIKGRVVEKKENVVSDLEEDSGLTLLCKVCHGRIALDMVEKHASTCAISFPVQIIRFEHSVEVDEREDKKKLAKAKKGEAEIAVLEDFPSTVLAALEKSGVPKEMYAKHLDVLVNVLNFASKMKFRLAASRPSILTGAANYALKNNLEPNLLAEVCKVAHGAAGKQELELARTACRVYEEGIAELNGKSLPPLPEKESRASEGQRILAAQKDVQVQAKKLYEHITKRQAKKLYSVSEKIGEGGYGKVYTAKCKDRKLQPERVAIKVMRHDETDAKAQRTNLRELLYLNKLKHPNIVELYRAHLVEEEELWLVLEYMEGGTLREASKVTVFDEDEVAFCAREILQAVAFMHENGCVHRDIKSHNVMMTVEGGVKLIDLGLVADVVKGISTMRGILGTTYWIPPEMIRGEQHSYPADVWSLGICLLELCHGHPPNRDSKLRALFLAGAGVAPVLEDPSQWSDQCGLFFTSCLIPEQTERATAAELLAHPWLNNACKLDKIRKRLREIFMNNALAGAGFF